MPMPILTRVGAPSCSSTGSPRHRTCWGSIAAALAPKHEVVAVDAPGHGAASAVRADLWEAADLLAAASGRDLCRLLDGRPRSPSTWRSRIPTRSHAAGAGRAAPRASRTTASAPTAASRRGAGRSPRSRRLDAFLERWLDQPLFATLPPRARDDDERRENTVAGLASSLRLAGTGTQEPLWDRLPSCPMPVAARRRRARRREVHRGRSAHGVGDRTGATLEPCCADARHTRATSSSPDAFTALAAGLARSGAPLADRARREQHAEDELHPAGAHRARGSAPGPFAPSSTICTGRRATTTPAKASAAERADRAQRRPATTRNEISDQQASTATRALIAEAHGQRALPRGTGRSGCRAGC